MPYWSCTIFIISIGIIWKLVIIVAASEYFSLRQTGFTNAQKSNSSTWILNYFILILSKDFFEGTPIRYYCFCSVVRNSRFKNGFGEGGFSMLVLVSYETLHLPWLFSLVSFNKALIFKRYEFIFLSYGTGHMGIQWYLQSLILDISV